MQWNVNVVSTSSQDIEDIVVEAQTEEEALQKARKIIAVYIKSVTRDRAGVHKALKSGSSPEIKDCSPICTDWELYAFLLEEEEEEDDDEEETV